MTVKEIKFGFSVGNVPSVGMVNCFGAARVRISAELPAQGEPDRQAYLSSAIARALKNRLALAALGTVKVVARDGGELYARSAPAGARGRQPGDGALGRSVVPRPGPRGLRGPAPRRVGGRGHLGLGPERSGSPDRVRG